MDHRLAIGIDVGGTKIAGALVDRSGIILQEVTLPTLATESAQYISQRIAEVINTLWQHAPQDIAGIGISCPGPVNPSTGIALNAVNLGWKNYPLRDVLQPLLTSPTLPIVMQNDVNALALGEMIYGSAKGFSDFVYIAPGTGLGGGAVSGGHVITGASGSAMEIGHIAVHTKNRPCRCGVIGCAEQYISGVGLLAGAAEYGLMVNDQPPTTQDIIQLARDKNQTALMIMADAAQALGEVMAMCAALLNPALFVIGGGIGLACYDLIVPEATLMLRQHVFADLCRDLIIVPATAGSSALGSAALVWHQLGEQL